jgi:hydroxymethylbilane synthase
VGQGALAIQVREVDRRTQRIIAELEHRPTRIAITAERAFLRHLLMHQLTSSGDSAEQPPQGQAGGCQVPMAAYGIVADGRVTIEGMVASLDGRKVIRRKVVRDTESAVQAGEELAQRVLHAGAGDILDEVRSGR